MAKINGRQHAPEFKFEQIKISRDNHGLALAVFNGLYPLTDEHRLFCAGSSICQIADLAARWGNAFSFAFITVAT
ncbi:MAG: hypothetical protein KDD70_10175 [Bdellovibrionales bacterium]|nr:hypothetical protein [Bdellovibrionales bacterium]